MREFMIETSYLRNNSISNCVKVIGNKSEPMNTNSSACSHNKMINFLKETAELRKNMISDVPVNNNSDKNSSLKSLPVNFSNNNSNNSNYSWLSNNTSSNKSFDYKNKSNYESRIKYLSDLDFKNPDFNSIYNPNFKVIDEIGKKCLEFTNEFRKKNRMPLLK